MRAVRDGSPSPPYREPLPLPSRSENERRSPRLPSPNESTHELRATPAQARSHELTACRKRKEARSAAAPCYQRGRTDWGKGEGGGTKSDTLRRRSPPSRCRTCRPSRRSLLRVGGSEVGALMGWVKQRRDHFGHPSLSDRRPNFGQRSAAVRFSDGSGQWRTKMSESTGQSMRGTF